MPRHRERKEGIVSGYNIRTDRFELAVEKMDMVNRSAQAKRMERINKKDEEKAIIESGEINGVETIQGENVSK